MQMTRIEVVVEAPALARVERALRDAGAPGWTVLPVLKGYGASGEWSREGQVGEAGRRVMVVCLCPPEAAAGLADAVLAAAGPLAGPLALAPVEVRAPGG